MRKLAVILVVLLLLCLCGTAQAVDLEAGWYVKIGDISMMMHDGPYQYGMNWYLTTPTTGSYPPFEVTSENPSWQRVITIPNSVSVPSGTSITFEGQPQVHTDLLIDRVDVLFQTDYDASRLALDLIWKHVNGTESLLRRQDQSGYVGGGLSALTPGMSLAQGDSVLIRVSAVPEPASILGLGASAFTALALGLRRSAPR